MPFAISIPFLRGILKSDTIKSGKGGWVIRSNNSSPSDAMPITSNSPVDSNPSFMNKSSSSSLSTRKSFIFFIFKMIDIKKLIFSIYKKDDSFFYQYSPAKKNYFMYSFRKQQPKPGTKKLIHDNSPHHLSSTSPERANHRWLKDQAIKKTVVMKMNSTGMFFMFTKAALHIHNADIRTAFIVLKRLIQLVRSIPFS